MPYEISYFRAAVIEATQRKSSLFHNHDGNAAVIYRYPLIQYKILNKKPSIICLESATEDIHFLLKERSFDFRIKDRSITFEIEDMHMTYLPVQTWDKDFKYNILHYMPFNQEAYGIYKKMEGQVEKLSLLEKKLEAHLLGFLKQLGSEEPVRLRCKIIDSLSSKYIEYKGQFHLTFNIEFKCNLSLPQYIGLGKGVSIGFGIIKRKKENE